jgi:hypothetical protein
VAASGVASWAVGTAAAFLAGRNLAEVGMGSFILKWNSYALKEWIEPNL